jgi:hypothetical protein
VSLSRRSSLRLLAAAAGTAALSPLVACQQGRRRRGGVGPWRVGVLQYVPLRAVDVTREGVLQGLVRQQLDEAHAHGGARQQGQPHQPAIKAQRLPCHHPWLRAVRMAAESRCCIQLNQ